MINEWTDWHERHKDKIEIIPGVDCWFWIAGRAAGGTHGRVRFVRPDGSKYSEYSHRAAFISFSGFTPTSGMVCHKCGQGLCVRPGHLYHGDSLSNGKDMADMGTGASLLTYDQAYDVRVRYKNGERLSDIASIYGIAFGSVYPIVMGKSYKHVPFPDDYSFGDRARKPLSAAEVSDIRKMLSDGITHKKISEKHNIAQSIVSRIGTGQRHKSR